MKTKLLIIILLLIPLSGSALSGKSTVSVLTAEPGVEYTTIFGHSSIRVTDDSLGIDVVYNFGSFDFSESFFYLKFLRGNLKYFLSYADYKSYLKYSYEQQQRVHEQILNLSLKERNAIFDKLNACYNSPERYYTYDFYYDNCATRVRDVIWKSVEKPIFYDKLRYSEKSFRQLLKPYISDNYWINFGINLVLGNQSDKTAGPSDYMFLPVYIQDILHHSSIVKLERIIVDPPVQKNESFNYSYLSPWIIVALILLMYAWPKTRKIAFYTLTSAVGLCGLFLFVIAIISKNEAFANNLNIYWTLPSVLILLVRHQWANDIIRLLYILLIVAFVLLWRHLPQELSTTFLPWMLCLSAMHLFHFKLTQPFNKLISE